MKKKKRKKKRLKHIQPGSNHRQSIQHPNDRKQAPKEKAKTEDTNKEKQAKKKKIYILFYSMVKHLKDWDISANLKQRHSIYVRPFTGTKVRSMKDYAKPCIREDNLDHIILHVGTNESSFESDAGRVRKSIVDLVKSLLSESRKVTISGIIPRNEQWNVKAEQVNKHLKEICSSVSMDYIDHFKNFSPKRNLNNSKLHLNEKGSWKVNDIFVSYLSDSFK